MACWITTHWPAPKSNPPFSRHVYVKSYYKSRPKPGDTVLVREAKTVKGKRCPKVTRWYLGQREDGVEIPEGDGGIIGKMVVAASDTRSISPNDLVYDYDGHLKDWSILQCKDFKAANMPLLSLQKVIGREGTLFLRLWRVPDKLADKLLAKLSS